MNQYLIPLQSKKLKHEHKMIALALVEGKITESEEVICGNSAGTRKEYIRRTVLNLFQKSPTDREVVKELNWIFDQLGREMAKLTKRLGKTKTDKDKTEIGEALQTLGVRAKAYEQMLGQAQPKEQPKEPEPKSKPPKTPKAE